MFAWIKLRRTCHLQPTGSELRSCRKCDFDVCDTCAAAQAPSGGDGQSIALAVAAGEGDPPVARVEFSIDRSNAKCHTPSNNVDVFRIKAGAFQLALWTGAVDRVSHAFRLSEPVHAPMGGNLQCSLTNTCALMQHDLVWPGRRFLVLFAVLSLEGNM